MRARLFARRGFLGFVLRWGLYHVIAIAVALVVLSASSLASGIRRGGGPLMFSNVATRAMAGSNRTSEGACWGDVDGDGDQDLFVPTSNAASRLWQNDGTGSFTDVAEGLGVRDFRSARFHPLGCALIDLDDDGDLDLYLSARNRAKAERGSLENKLFRNNGDGTFTDLTQKAGVGMRRIGAASSDWADYDGDGDYDGFVAVRWGGKERTNALFEQTVPFAFADVAPVRGVADVEGPPWTFAGTWFDYDADGDPDLLLAVDWWGTELYRNDGVSFTRVTTTAFPPATDDTPGAPPNNAMGVTWGDYDNDGCADVFITGLNVYGQGGFEARTLSDFASRLYRNTCRGTFTDVTKAVGLRTTGVVEWSANFVDFDNDGDLDLAVVAANVQQDNPRRREMKIARRVVSALVTIPRRLISPRLAAWAYRYEAMIPASGEAGLAAAMPKYLYQNRLETGTATFIDVTLKMGVEDLGATRGSAWADMDNDGDLDWFVPNRATPSRLFRNNGPVGNYLRVHLVGARLRDAVGAWVKIKVGTGTQLRHVHVLDGYLSQSQMDPHFGLGAAPGVEEVWVRWPGETRWVLACRGVPANRTVTITEASGGCR